MLVSGDHRACLGVPRESDDFFACEVVDCRCVMSAGGDQAGGQGAEDQSEALLCAEALAEHGAG